MDRDVELHFLATEDPRSFTEVNLDDSDAI
jgi:hypothetical protein